MALAPLSQTIFLTEDGSAVASPKPVTIPPLVAVPPVTLGPLNLSGTLIAGKPSSGSIDGATTGSTIVETIGGLTVDSDARSYAWDGTGPVGTYANGLTETHWNATNSGRTSPITITSATAPPTTANTNADSTLLVTQVDGAQTAFEPAVTLATEMGYL